MTSDTLGGSRTSPAFQSAIFASSEGISPPISGPQVPAPQPIKVFTARCEARASLFINGMMSLHEAVDKLQADAERNGFLDAIGQGAVQSIMAIAFAADRQLPGEPDLVELNDLLEADFALRAAERVKRWEAADPLDNGSGAPNPPPRKPEPYRPAESTISSFWYVVGLNDLDYLKAWLRNHPADAPALHKLLESK